MDCIICGNMISSTRENEHGEPLLCGECATTDTGDARPIPGAQIGGQSPASAGRTQHRSVTGLIRAFQGQLHPLLNWQNGEVPMCRVRVPHGWSGR